MTTEKPPRKCEIATRECYCDQCKCDLSRYEFVWIWREFLACSKACIFKLKAVEDQDDELDRIVDGLVHLGEERDVDLL